METLLSTTFGGSGGRTASITAVPLGGLPSSGGLASGGLASGGLASGGRIMYTGGRTASGGVVGYGGRIGFGGFGGSTMGGRMNPTLGGTGGRGQGGFSGSSMGGRGQGGFSGSMPTGGTPPNPGCPDEISYDGYTLSTSRDLGNYADRYTPSCDATPGSSDFTVVSYFSQPDTYVIDTLGSQTDTVLAVYGGQCGATELACNDDDNDVSRQSRVVVDVAYPQYITIVVDGFKGATGDFVLHTSKASALVDVVLAVRLPMSTTASTNGRPDRFTSACNGKMPSSDYTYLIQAPVTGTYQFLVESNTFDAILSLREGGAAGDEIACNDDFSGLNPSVTYALTAGQYVALIVDGFEGSAGDFTLSISQNTNDSGSCCSPSATRVGCIDPTIAQCVCKNGSSCCLELWDASCVQAVQSLGCGTCGG